MPTQKKDQSDQNLEKLAQRFLQEHPEAKVALDIFGITNDCYQQYLAAQQTPIFYTASSTIAGEPNGKLE